MYGSSSFRLDENKYADDLWKVSPHKYEHSMNIVAKIDHANYLNANPANVLGAFKDIECLGNITATQLIEDESLYFITIYGEENSLVRFDYFDATSTKTYRADNIVEFEANSLIGSVASPYPITINVTAQDVEVFFDMSIYPNPFEDVFSVEFQLMEDAAVEIQLFDVMGRYLKNISSTELKAGAQSIKIDTVELTKGVYFIELIVDEIAHKKMIIKS